MKKTVISRILCLILALLLPLCAFAEAVEPAAPEAAPTQTVVTLSVTPGEAMSSLPEIGDLCKVAALQFRALGEQYLGFSLLLNGKESFTANFRADKDGLYGDSIGLYPQTLYVNFEDLQKVLEEAAKTGSASNVAALGSLQSSLRTMLSAMEKQQTDPAPSFYGKDLKDPAVRQAILDMANGDESYLALVEDLLGRATVTEGDFTAEDHDPATTQTAILMTQKDVLVLLETQYMKNLLKQQLTPAYPELSGDALDQKVAESIAQAKEQFSKMDFVMPMTILTNGDDVVSCSYPLTMKSKGDSTPIDLSMTIDYRRLTTDGNAKHSVRMIASETGSRLDLDLDGYVTQFANGNYDLNLTITNAQKEQVAIKGTYETIADQSTGLLSLLIPAQPEILLQFTQNRAGSATNNQLAVYQKAAAVQSMAVTQADKPLFTLNLQTEEVPDDGRFDTLKAATPDTALQVLKLSPADMQTFQNTFMNTAMQTGMGLLSQLPESLFKLLVPTQPNLPVQ